MTNDATDNAENQAKAQLEGIQDMLERLEHAQECDGDECDKDSADYGTEIFHDEDSASQAIDEGPLSVQVRSDWHNPGEESEAVEYELLLCTGGPACRIVGDLGQHGQPERARIEYQDWGTPWTELILDSTGYAALLAYAHNFYFGE